jgi:pSer/pThr/pTyr-binding forkhead associated (FHA) protein
MAKLTLQFENRVLKDVPVGADLTIGRLPDNGLVIDNPAVSGHHARVFLEGERYVVEDLRSRNGTYVNEKHVIRHTLQTGDVLLVGKHKLLFDETAEADVAALKPVLPTLGKTAYLDTKQHRALLARLREERARERARAQVSSDASKPMVAGDGGGVLQVIAGNADRPEYRLEARTSFIGKSEIALVRLRGWLAPKAAAAIEQSDGVYAVIPMKGKVLVNGTRLEARHVLNDGDLLEFAGLTLRFHSRPDHENGPSAPVHGDARTTAPADA